MCLRNFIILQLANFVWNLVRKVCKYHSRKLEVCREIFFFLDVLSMGFIFGGIVKFLTPPNKMTPSLNFMTPSQNFTKGIILHSGEAFILHKVTGGHNIMTWGSFCNGSPKKFITFIQQKSWGSYCGLVILSKFWRAVMRGPASESYSISHLSILFCFTSSFLTLLRKN